LPETATGRLVASGPARILQHSMRPPPANQASSPACCPCRTALPCHAPVNADISCGAALQCGAFSRKGEIEDNDCYALMKNKAFAFFRIATP